MRGTLVLESSHVTVRGQGMYSTVLDFTDQEQGAQGLLVTRTGHHFTAQDFAIINPEGDGIKTEYITGATFERIRVEWTAQGAAKADNGDYGLYPAQNTDVLVSNSIVIGSRDAGIYIGQSNNVIVRWSYVEGNVLGIEIENCMNADVYGNVAEGNTGGIAVFNLPGLQQIGHTVRVFDNSVFENNHPNFAAGGILAQVPGGTGILVVGNDQTEIFNNTVYGNQTANIALTSFQIAGENPLDPHFYDNPDYDPFMEGVYVHDNVLSNGGTNAGDTVLGFIIGSIFAPASVPDIMLGGWVDGKKIGDGSNFDDDPNFGNHGDLVNLGPIPFTQYVEAGNKVCVKDNAGTFANTQMLATPPNPTFDLSNHDCTTPVLPAIVITGASDPPVVTDPYTPEEIAALCTPGAGINWDALVVNCPNLSDYNLFADPTDPTTAPLQGGVKFDLTMPLFSDYTEKDRYLFLPPDERGITIPASWSDDDVFAFPDGTVIAKTFSFTSAVHGVDQIVETRLLIKRAGVWVGLPYIWADDGSNAALSIGGGLTHWTDTSVTPAEVRPYWIPSIADCGSCHAGVAGDVPVGPKARVLDRDLDYGPGVGVKNQLVHMAELGFLTGLPVADPADLPAAVAELPGLEGWEDVAPGGAAEDQHAFDEIVRAYLDANCAACHSATGRAGFTGYWLDYDSDPFDISYGLCRRPVAAGSAAMGLAHDVEPGQPDQSILIVRLESNEAAIKMPEIERNVVHQEGVDLLRAWVSSLPGSCP